MRILEYADNGGMKNLIEIKNLRYEIPHSGTILKDINLELAQGEFLGVLGHNGAGKSTLLDLLMGFRNTKQGLIRVLEEDPNANIRRNKNKVTYISHEANLKGNISVREFLDFSADFYPNYSRDEELRYLKLFELDKEVKIGALSTGQQKKVQFIAAASAIPEILILDEVTAVFDPEYRSLFFKELRRLKSNFNTSILLATNLADDLVGNADKVLFIKEGVSTIHKADEIENLFNTEKVA